MTTKLTLSVEKKVIEKAKRYAGKTGRSLSEIIETYLGNLTNEESEVENVSPRLKEIIGSVKLPKNFDEDRERRKYLSRKYS